MCDQNQVTSTLDGLSQDLQSPMLPMQSAQHVQPSQSASQQQPSSQNQLNDMPNMVETLGVPLQQNIIDPYRRLQGIYHIRTIVTSKDWKIQFYSEVILFCSVVVVKT